MSEKKPAPALQLMSRQRCHLCTLAAQMLQAQGVAFEVVDIDQHSDLQARYGMLVPVVYCALNDAELLYPFDSAQLSDWLASLV